jgi:hypothetical protein
VMKIILCNMRIYDPYHLNSHAYDDVLVAQVSPHNVLYTVRN